MIITIKGRRIETGNVVFTVNDRPVHHVVRHSPTGMEYGYGGSGPSDAARSILLTVLPSDQADKYYMQFKWDFVANWKGNEVEDTIDLGAWIAKQGG
jgi:hypothetical protein